MSNGASAFPMLVIVPARCAHEAKPLFLEPLGAGAIIDGTLDAAERQRDRGAVTLLATTDDARIIDHIGARGGDWLTRLRETDEEKAGYFSALCAGRDHATTESGEAFASVLVLEPSHPFRPEGLVANAIEILERDPALDTVVPVVREYGNIWTRDGHGALHRMRTPMGQEFYREIAGLSLLTRPHAMTRETAMGKDVGFVVVEEQWALIDIHGPDGVAFAQRYSGLLHPAG